MNAHTRCIWLLLLSLLVLPTSTSTPNFFTVTKHHSMAFSSKDMMLLSFYRLGTFGGRNPVPGSRFAAKFQILSTHIGKGVQG